MITVPAVDLLRVLRSTLPHASADNTFPALRGVRLITDGRNLTTAATDRYTFAEDTAVLAEEISESWSVTLPTVGVKQVIDLIKRETAQVTIRLEDFDIRIEVGKQTITLMTNTGEFPKYLNLFPDASREPTAVSEINFNPSYMARFARSGYTVSAKNKINALTHLTFYGATKAIVVTLIGVDTFRGLIMPISTAGERVSP